MTMTINLRVVDDGEPVLSSLRDSVLVNAMAHLAYGPGLTLPPHWLRQFLKLHPALLLDSAPDVAGTRRPLQ
jgi:hypothetical protein